MTPAQRTRYWRLWSKALKTAFRTPDGELDRVSQDDFAVEIEGLAFAAAFAASRAVTPDDLRHAAHRLACGRDRSSTTLTNREIDRVFALFRLLADPLDLEARLEWQTPERGERRRNEYVVRHAAPEAYASHVAHGKFGTRNLASLDNRQTKALAMTLRNRGRAAANA
jgi:hypothetical protein